MSPLSGRRWLSPRFHSRFRILGYGEESVSVAMEEIAAEDWKDAVYQPDIVAKEKNLCKSPGYTM